MTLREAIESAALTLAEHIGGEGTSKDRHYEDEAKALLTLETIRQSIAYEQSSAKITYIDASAKGEQ